MAEYAKRGLWALAVAAAAGTVLGTFGDMWWGLDLLANFRLQYLIVLVGSAVVLAAWGPRQAALVLGVLALFNALLIAPLYIDDPAPAADDARLEIVSANMQRHNSRVQINWMIDTEPDLIFLFESSRRTEDLVASAELGYEITSGIDPENAFGLSILSKQSIEIETLLSSRHGGTAIRLETELGGAPVVVFAIHPPSPSNPTRSEARDKLLARVGRAAASETLPVIVVGDFNATPWSTGFRQLVDPGDLQNSQVGFGYGSTWHANLWPILGVPLDHLVHSRDLTTVDREVGPSAGPDHRPIRVVLARTAEA